MFWMIPKGQRLFLSEMQKDKLILIIVFLVFFLIFSSGGVFLYYKINALEESISNIDTTKTSENSKSLNTSTQGVEFSKEEITSLINDTIDEKLKNTTGTKTTTAAKTSTSEEALTRTAYIPLVGPITTTSTSWVDATGTDISIDLATDYGKDAKVSWEAFLSIANSNGTAYARLFDVTHGIAVSGSELSVTDNATSTNVTSKYISLWAGRNLYRVQVKSLNSFVATFSSGRIKIVY